MSQITFEDEGTTLYFTGIWIPVEVIEKARSGEVTWTDALFYGVVKAMSKPGGPGCWARNASLAKFFRVTVRAIQKMVSNLKRAGLIRSFYDGDYRYLQVITPENYAEVPMNCSSPHELYDTGRISLLLRNKQILDNKARNGVSLAQSPKGNESVATFKKVDSTPANILPFDQDLAEELHDKIVKVRKVYMKWSIIKWSDAIRLLRKDLKDDRDRILRVFDWWCDNVKTKGVPTILNAAQFRKHFIWIEEKAEKDIGKKVEIDDETKIIAKRVAMKGWPGKSRDQVEACIQLSKEQIVWLLQIIRKVQDNINVQKDARFANFVRQVRLNIGDPKTFVEKWMSALHKKYARWKEWNGDLIAQAFRPEHELFKSMGRRWATMYAQDQRLFTRFMKEAQEWM